MIWNRTLGEVKHQLSVGRDGVALSYRAPGNGNLGTGIGIRAFLAGKLTDEIRERFGESVLVEAIAEAQRLAPPEIIEPSVTLEDCEICAQLPEAAHVQHEAGERLPEAADALVIAPGHDPDPFRRDHLQVCPRCGTYYEYEYRHEYTFPQSETDEWLTRLSPAQALARR